MATQTVPVLTASHAVAISGDGSAEPSYRAREERVGRDSSPGPRKGALAMALVQTLGFRRRHLPHWTVADRPYFVTFRLKGTLPRELCDALARERRELVATGACEGSETVYTGFAVLSRNNG